MGNKNQMDTNIAELAEALKKEPVEIQEIITNGVKSILEEYAENCCLKDTVNVVAIDPDDKVECNFSLPALWRASSYKSYGIRYFAFEASISVYYGKKFDFIIEVACTEHINDIFCTKLDGKNVLACNWLEPYEIRINDVKEREYIAWKVEDQSTSVPEIVEL